MKTNRTTPQWLVDKMWYMITNDYGVICDDNLNLLEPSAGEGNLLKVSEDHFAYEMNGIDVTAIELNLEKYVDLKSFVENKFTKSTVIHCDFMSAIFPYEFSVVLAAPPFNNNVDVEHIQKMYRALKPGGFLVSLTTPFWLTNNEPHQVAFREFLKDKEHTVEMLPDMTFVEKGKTVPTSIIKIRKSIFLSEED